MYGALEEPMIDEYALFSMTTQMTWSYVVGRVVVLPQGPPAALEVADTIVAATRAAASRNRARGRLIGPSLGSGTGTPGAFPTRMSVKPRELQPARVPLQTPLPWSGIWQYETRHPRARLS